MVNSVRGVLGLALILMLASPSYAEKSREDAGKHLALNLVGTGSMYQRTVPDVDGDGADDLAMCFNVDLVDVHTNHVIGTGTDCLAQVTPTNAGVALVGTTYFQLPSGLLIVRGKTSVQPVFHPTVTPRGLTVTHITGASSNQNAVLGGTGRFSGATGTVRLSGMVNMANFGGNIGDPISFDCLFIVALN